MNNQNLKLAIQKNGRLTKDTLSFLRKSGLEFESSQQKLFSSCRNLPLEILYVRHNDIPNYVQTGIVDLGIVGQNVINEKMPQVKKLLNLRFCFCSLVAAVLKESSISSIEQLNGLKIATSYPNSTKYFLAQNNLTATIVPIGGSVEITPTLGVANAIVDLTSTGSTLALNDLRPVAKLYDSEAVLIANNKSIQKTNKQQLINKLLLRFKGVLSAQKYKYVMMNAPENILPKIKKIIPGLKSPTVSPLAKSGWISVQSVVKEDIFWETIERLQQIGATGIIVLPIEKMIN